MNLSRPHKASVLYRRRLVAAAVLKRTQKKNVGFFLVRSNRMEFRMIFECKPIDQFSITSRRRLK